MEIPDELFALLRGLPWRTEIGGNHIKVFLDSRLILVLPKRMRRNDNIQGNSRASVRRAIRDYHQRSKADALR
jgi:hypothetical protein